MRKGALLVLVFAGCGGSGNRYTPGQSNTCSIAFSGAVNGTADCSPVETLWNATNNTGGLAFAVTGYGPIPNAQAAFSFPGQPQVGHYKSTDAGATGGITIGNTSSTWTSQVGNGVSPQGSYDVNLTAVVNGVPTPSGYQYSASGTVDSTLVPTSGQVGNVTAHVTFSP